MCNNLKLIPNFRNNFIKVKGLILEDIFSEHGTVKIRLAIEDGREGLILKLRNIFYFPNSLLNLDSLGLLNNAKIYYDNEN